MVGVGVMPQLHITKQAMAVISKVEHVLYFVDPQLEEIFTECNVGSKESIDYLYVDGAVDDDNYGSILKYIMDSLKQYNSIAFVCQGNPRLGVSLVDMLWAIQESEGFDLELIAGVSSFETLIIDVRCDPLERGVVMMDANRWLLFNHVPNIELDYFIYHICSIATKGTNYSDPSIDNRLDLLQASLLQAYPPDHKCKIVQSSGAGTGSEVIFEVAMANLQEAMPEIGFATTLFIPAAREASLEPGILNILLGQ